MNSLAIKDQEQPIALFSEDGQHWKQQDDSATPIVWQSDERVTRLVIGSLDTSEAIDFQFPLDPTITLTKLYPNLTHLHLWGLRSLESLPRLPSALECLDVRHCQSLCHIGALPESITTLVLNSCIKLEIGPNFTTLKRLYDLELADCMQLSGDWIQSVLDDCVNLQRIDVSGCERLRVVKCWPDKLDTIKLNNCKRLKGLPEAWPGRLRRLELSGCIQIGKLTDFPDSIDYVDLSHTHSLLELPANHGTPRTLFLYDSGLQAPPATEHGEDREDNVASDVAGYFADRELTGDGEVRRCKVQLLGNGAAGKTTLAYYLVGKDPALAKVEGSTPGLQFIPWAVDALIDGHPRSVEAQLWDFGGQEIYHGTHRLFMGTGSVFVIVWNPNQDGEEPDLSTSGYQDTWRPLIYWIDLVLNACRAPEIIVVCSHQSQSDAKLEQRFNDQLSESAHASRLQLVKPRLFFADSLNGTGQTEDIRNELSLSIGSVVGRHGKAVPAYWEIAQDMVKGWLLNKDQEAAIEQDTFSSELIAKIGALTDENKYPQLKQAINSGQFILTEQDRVRRTLNFLTRSGWIYWNEKLFKGQVIVDQELALKGIYKVLERKDNTTVFNNIRNNSGRFTQSQLAEWVWNDAHFDEDAQSLLLSFMEVCGACFKLRSAEHAWNHEAIYVSPAHLPSMDELTLQEQFARESNELDVVSVKPIRSKYLYKHHWKRYLAAVGSEWGVDARYARDGFYIKTKDGLVILVTLEMDKRGVGGTIRIKARGNDDDDTVEKLRSHIEQFLPDETRGIDRTGGKSSIEPRKEVRVFLSYAWNRADEEGEIDYEEAVDAIEDFINNYNAMLERTESDEPRIALLRDRNEMKRADSIVEFTSQAGDTSKVIVVHSDKYWCSANCLFELHRVFKGFSNDEMFFESVVISVDVNSDLENKAESYVDSWVSGAVNLPTRLENRWFEEKRARRRAASLIDEFSDIISDGLDVNYRWDSNDPNTVLDKVAERLGIPHPDSLDDD